MDIIELNAVPLTVLAPPTPPAGSDYDQSTIDGFTDGTPVAGEVNGDPAHERYIAQSLKNDRAPITGYGGILGYLGNVTKPLYIGLAATKINPNSPDAEWLKVGRLDPSQIEPGKWYYVYATFLDEPVNWPPGQTLYMIACTDESLTENPTKSWVWTYIESAPYTKGEPYIFDGTNWTITNGDMSFFTWTESEGPPPNCPDYTNQADCIAAGCYWWSDGTCHDTPETLPCEDYINKSACLAANCYWYKKYFWEPEKCYSTQQNMMMDYLPFIIAAGVGGTIIVLALARPKLAPKPA